MSLKVVHDSKAAHQVDFVAVHGLNFTGAADPGTSTWERDGKIWMRDFLPYALERSCRVMIYEYNSSPAIGSSTIKLDDHAKKLLLLLSLKRKIVPLRKAAKTHPLVFICHSLGGILVKEALVEATLDESYQDILRATQLLVFFGTPHQGGNLATVGDYVAKLYRTLSRNPQNDLVEALKVDSDASTRRFEQFRHKHEDFLVISCFEGKHYQGAGIIVDKRSATLNLPGKREKQVPIDADHSAMCKFASNDEPDCDTIMELINLQLETALIQFKDIEPLLDRLDYANRRAREAQIGDVNAQEDTFAWVWTSPFASWLAGPAKLFWIRGKPASGKSTLINHIAKEKRTQETILRVFQRQQCIIITFFFDFRQKSNDANSLKGLLLSILHALVSQTIGLAASLKTRFPNWRDIYLCAEWEMPVLHDMLDHCVMSTNRPTCIFIDGLDEFHGERKEQLDLAIFLQRLAAFELMKVCFASRPHQVLQQKLGAGPFLDMQEWNRSGMQQFVFKTLRDMDLARDPLVTEEIRDLAGLVADMAEGVFLWARFALDNLVELWSEEQLDFASLLLALSKMPRDVEKLWDRSREKLDPEQKAEANVLLQLICFAAKPLKLAEFVEVWTYQDLVPLPTWLPGVFSRDRDRIISEAIERLSCGLLEVGADPSGGERILLVHKSVQRYLETRGWWLPGEDKFGPEELWLSACIKCIEHTTWATERTLCYQNRPHHKAGNPVCRQYGCYSDRPRPSFPQGPYPTQLIGGLSRYTSSLRETEVFLKSGPIVFEGTDSALPAFSSMERNEKATLEDYMLQYKTTLFISVEALPPQNTLNINFDLSSVAPVTATNEMVAVMSFVRDKPHPQILVSRAGTRSSVKSIKVAVIGTHNVGKSLLTIRLVDDVYVESFYPSIENSFSTSVRHKNQEYALEIIDTAVGHRMPDFTEEARQVSGDQASVWAMKHHCGWIEASAKMNENVNEAFTGLLDEIEKMQHRPNDQKGNKCTLILFHNQLNPLTDKSSNQSRAQQNLILLTPQYLTTNDRPTTAKLSPLIIPRTLSFAPGTKTAPACRPSTDIGIMSEAKKGRRRRSSSIIYQEPMESAEQKSDQAILPNLNAEWVNAKGAWLIHPILIAALKILFDIMPGVSQETSWTMTNISYMFGSYLMFHYVRGVPFEFNAGAYDNLNMWEQIDNGDQYTPAKKFLLSVPILLFLLSTHYTHYDFAYFTINFLAVLAVIIPKLPSLSKSKSCTYIFIAKHTLHSSASDNTSSQPLD
ncbi:hypothetical protein MMC25_001308 [Agyrium rufum]|nr:hypothetical protein [Agyrium rufum]